MKRRRTRQDARAYAITLTPLGRDLLKTSEPIVNRIDETLVSVLTSARASTFVDNLRTIVGSFQSEKS